MGPREIETLVSTLEVMRELELRMSDFYSPCAAAFPEDGPFWEKMSQAELDLKRIPVFSTPK